MDMNYSLGDIAAATRGMDGDGFGNGGSWWIILLFLVMFGNNGWGGNRGVGEAVATEADVQRGFNQQATTSKLDQLAYGLSDLGYENARLANATQMQSAQLAAQNQLSMCQGFGGVERAIADLGAQMQQCCCDLKSQMAQDKIESLQAKVSEQAAAINNAQQSQFILSQLGRWRSNPPCPDGCGCGGYGSGWGFAA